MARKPAADVAITRCVCVCVRCGALASSRDAAHRVARIPEHTGGGTQPVVSIRLYLEATPGQIGHLRAIAARIGSLPLISDPQQSWPPGGGGRAGRHREDLGRRDRPEEIASVAPHGAGQPWSAKGASLWGGCLQRVEQGVVRKRPKSDEGCPEQLAEIGLARYYPQKIWAAQAQDAWQPLQDTIARHLRGHIGHKQHSVIHSESQLACFAADWADSRGL